MMKTKAFTQTLFGLFLSGLFFFAATAPALASGKLFLDPASKNVSKNEEFEMRVTIDSENNNIFGVDAIIKYSTNDLEVTSVENGGFFSDFKHAVNSNDGKVEIHGLFSNLYETKSGIGTIAIMKMKAKSEAGLTELTFDCGSDNTTQILNGDGDNILSCTSVNNSNIFFGTSTATPKATSTPVATSKATPKGTTKPSATPVVITLSSYPPSPSPVEESMAPTPEVTSMQTALPLPVIIGGAILAVLLLLIILMIINKIRKNRQEEDYMYTNSSGKSNPTPPTPSNPPQTQNPTNPPNSPFQPL